MYCIFDTETNGLPEKNDFSNVYMTQIAIIITDGTKNYVEKEFLVKGDFEISKEITELTGITKEITEEKGISFKNIWSIINKLLETFDCSYIIAHNMRFDRNVIRQEYKRLKNLKNYHKTEGEDEDLQRNIYINKIKKFEIINEKFINKVKYDLKILKRINSFLELNNNESKEFITKHIIDIYNQKKKQNNFIYNEKFFQLLPLCSMSVFKEDNKLKEKFNNFKFFKKEVNKMIKKKTKTELIIKIIQQKKILKRNQLNDLYYDIFNLQYYNFLKNHKLETIYNELHEVPYIQTHTALDDCYMLQKSLNKVEFNIINCICN